MSVSTMENSETPNPQGGAQPAGSRRPAMSNRELCCWGAAGGLITVLATNGLFDRETIAMMVEGSAPVTQLVTLGILSFITAFVGGSGRWRTVRSTR